MNPRLVTWTPLWPTQANLDPGRCADRERGGAEQKRAIRPRVAGPSQRNKAIQAREQSEPPPGHPNNASGQRSANPEALSLKSHWRPEPPGKLRRKLGPCADRDFQRAHARHKTTSDSSGPRTDPGARIDAVESCRSWKPSTPVDLCAPTVAERGQRQTQASACRREYARAESSGQPQRRSDLRRGPRRSGIRRARLSLRRRRCWLVDRVIDQRRGLLSGRGDLGLHAPFDRGGGHRRVDGDRHDDRGRTPEQCTVGGFYLTGQHQTVGRDRELETVPLSVLPHHGLHRGIGLHGARRCASGGQPSRDLFLHDRTIGTLRRCLPGQSQGLGQFDRWRRWRHCAQTQRPYRRHDHRHDHPRIVRRVTPRQQPGGADEGTSRGFRSPAKALANGRTSRLNFVRR